MFPVEDKVPPPYMISFKVGDIIVAVAWAFAVRLKRDRMAEFLEVLPEGQSYDEIPTSVLAGIADTPHNTRQKSKLPAELMIAGSQHTFAGIYSSNINAGHN
jgi:hypothetical protein